MNKKIKSLSKESKMGKAGAKMATKIVKKDAVKANKDVKKTKKMVDPLTNK
jgi:hypothetical protein